MTTTREQQRPARAWSASWLVLGAVLAVDASTRAQSEPLFPGPVSYKVGSVATEVQCGDLNGDGRIDLVTPCPETNSISVLYGNADGLFDPVKQISVGSYPLIYGDGTDAVALGDVNGDGRLDLAVGHYQDVAVYVLVAKPTGGFFAPVPYACPSEPVAVHLSDLTGDGALDLLALTMNGHVLVFPSMGGGVFGAPTPYPAGANHFEPGDLNGDGLMDVVYTRGQGKAVSVRFGIGGGALGVGSDLATFAHLPTALALGDVDGDGDLDVVVAVKGGTSPGSLEVLLGRGNGSFGLPLSFPIGPEPLALSLADMNADSRLDAVVVDYDDQTLSVLLGAGGGQFGVPLSCATSPGPSAVCAAQLNGDGALDVAVAGEIATVCVFAGEGRGQFHAAPTFPVDVGPAAVVAADVSGDGHVDLVTANALYGSTGTVSVLLGDGRGGFAPQATIDAGTAPRGLAAGDLDEDGDLDLVVADPISNTVSLLLGTGGGSFAPAAPIASGSGPSAVSLGRLDEDSLLDVVFANSSAGTVTVLLGQPGAGFGPPSDFSLGPSPQSPQDIALGDVDGDGRLDLVIANQGAGRVCVLLNQGAGSFGNKKTYYSGSPRRVSLADLDADGDLDVVVAQGPYSIGVLLGVGDGTFGTQTPYPAGIVPNDLAVGDIDGDGNLDVVVACNPSSSVQVMLGDGHGSLGPAQYWGLPHWCEALALADFDIDGRLDVAAVGMYASSFVSLLLNTGGAPIGSWTDIGFGLDGVAGSPLLSGSGSLVPGSPGEVKLTSAAPAAPGMLFVSTVDVPRPFKCGVLVPSTPLVRQAFATNANGVAAWAWSTWPSSLNALDLYLQAAVADPAAACGVAFSNAVHAVVP